jgi:glycine dehydrogenase subunit 1
MELSPRIVHPYIPNSVPAVIAEMLKAAGASSIEDFYAAIPERLRLKRPLDLPPPLLSETELARHVDGLLQRNPPVKPSASWAPAAGSTRSRLSATRSIRAASS